MIKGIINNILIKKIFFNCKNKTIGRIISFISKNIYNIINNNIKIININLFKLKINNNIKVKHSGFYKGKKYINNNITDIYINKNIIINNLIKSTNNKYKTKLFILILNEHK